MSPSRSLYRDYHFDRPRCAAAASPDADVTAAESSLARLRREASAAAAACAGIPRREAPLPQHECAPLAAIDEFRAFGTTLPHARRPMPEDAPGGAASHAVLRKIEPELHAWLCRTMARIASEPEKRIYVTGYAQDNPELAFALGEAAATFLIQGGVDPRRISVLRDDRPQAGSDMWMRITEAPQQGTSKI